MRRGSRSVPGQPQLHQLPRNEVGLGLELLLQRLPQQGDRVLRRAALPVRGAPGRREGRRPGRAAVEARFREGLRCRPRALDGAPQVGARVAQVLGAGGEGPHQLAQPGQRLGVPRGGYEQHGALRRTLLEPAGQLQQRRGADRLVRSGGEPGHSRGAVVERLHQENFLAPLGRGSRDEADDVFGDGVLPGGVGPEAGRLGHEPAGSRGEVPERAGEVLGARPEPGEAHGRELEFVLEQEPRGVAAVHVDERVRPEIGRAQPAGARIELHQQDRPLDGLAVQLPELAVADVEERAVQPRRGRGRRGDGVAGQRPQRETPGPARDAEHAAARTDDRHRERLGRHGPREELLERRADGVGRPAVAGGAGAAVAVGGQRADRLGEGGRLRVVCGGRPARRPEDQADGQDRRRETAAAARRQRPTRSGRAGPHSRTSICPTEIDSSSRASILSMRPSRIQTTRSETFSILMSWVAEMTVT